MLVKAKKINNPVRKRNAKIKGTRGYCNYMGLLVEIRINVNSTDYPDDNLIWLKSPVLDKRIKMNCRIRMLKQSKPTTEKKLEKIVITLTNPDGRLRFSEANDRTKRLLLRADSKWVKFEVTGEVASEAIGDAIIEAHLGVEKGPLICRKKCTVFWFDQAKIDIVPEGSYSLEKNSYWVHEVGKVAVRISASARVRPEGLECDSLELAHLRVVVMQNTFPPSESIVYLHNPNVKWKANSQKNDTVRPYSKIHYKIKVDIKTNDSDERSQPFYKFVANSQGSQTFNKTRQRIDGCTYKPNDYKKRPYIIITKTSDTPRIRALNATFNKISDATLVNKNIADIDYSVSRITSKENFRTWVVVTHKFTQQYIVLKERVWRLELDSNKTNQKATVEQQTDPTTVPVESPFANVEFNDKKNTIITAVGNSRKIFTKK